MFGPSAVSLRIARLPVRDAVKRPRVHLQSIGSPWLPGLWPGGERS